MRPMSQKLRLHLGPCGLVVPLSISYGRCKHICMRPMSQKLHLHLGPCGLVVPLSISYRRCLGFYPSQVGFAYYYQKLRLSFSFIYTKTESVTVIH